MGVTRDADETELARVSWVNSRGSLSGLYLVHSLIFRDVYKVAIYGVSDLAFLPIQVLLVVVISEEVISNLEKQSKAQQIA